MRYLSVDNISNALKRGNSVEQFLGRNPDNPNYIRRIELRPSDGSVELWVHDAEDIGSEDWLDLYEFPRPDSDDPEMPIGTFQDAHSAIAFANEKALLRNKVMDSLEESDVIDGGDAETDPTEISNDQLARI